MPDALSLAALIAAYHEADEPGGGLRAMLPLAGRTLLERQVRLAASAGASPIVVLVERIPPDLLSALDRLKGEGLSVVTARSAAEAAEAVGADDRLLLVADGLVASAGQFDRLLAIGGPTILTVPDLRVDDRFERIDAHSRWAGLAVLEAELLKRTAAMLQDWDLQSTLLRRAVQSGARQLGVRGEAADAQLTIAERRTDLADMQARMLEGASLGRRDWASRFLLSPLERAGTRLLMPTQVTAAWLSLLAACLMGFAVLAFATGWLATGMALLLLSTPAEGIGERLAALRMQLSYGPSWWSHVFPALGVAALMALAITRAEDDGWGCVLLAGTTIAFLAALQFEMRGARVDGRGLLAERTGMIWLYFPFALLGLWTAGLGALAAYAAGSFFWVQRQVHRDKPAPPQD
jgi:hypothetical protein